MFSETSVDIYGPQEVTHSGKAREVFISEVERRKPFTDTLKEDGESGTE